MKINGIEIPDNLLIEAGWTPPQEFEYPLYRKDSRGNVFAFTGFTKATVLVSAGDWFDVGRFYRHLLNHESECWTPCEKPKPEPKPLQFDGTPVWAYVSADPNGYEDAVESDRRLHVVAGNCHSFRAIRNGESNTESTNTITWQYAWEIPEDEA